MPDMQQVLQIVYTVVIPALVLLAFILANAVYLQYVERKLWADMQDRLGPMRAGWHGLLQPIADSVKFLMKEDIIPAKADKAVFSVAPLILLTMSFASMVVIPFGPPTDFYGILTHKVPLWVSNLNIGILFIIAFASIGTYGVIMAGWASNNKYSLMGGFRSAAQMISYEIPMAFAVITVVLLAGSLNLADIVTAQEKKWFLITPIGPLAFFLYFVAGLAETNRTPFDLPEAESEIVAGYCTEYSGIRFGLFFMAEYMNMLVVSLVASLMFLGGWLPVQILPNTAFGAFAPVALLNKALAGIPPTLWLLVKVYFFIFVFAWIRGTLPRYRYDQLMSLSWKFLLPLSLATMMLAAYLKLRGWV